ncbi:MAG: hypothetical protein AAFZ15_34240 [Bacteroidota bacterium]
MVENIARADTKKNALEKSKLYESLDVLNEVEWKSLGKWLDSPWCNSNKKLCDFYQLLNKNRHRKNKFDKESIFKKLYPGKKYNNKIFNNLMREFVLQVERFLAAIDLLSDTVRFKDQLGQSYLLRKKLNLFNEISRSAIQLIEEKATKEWEDYLQLGIVHEKLYFQPDQDIRYQPNPDNLIGAEKNLDLFYALGKFRILHEYAARKELLKYELKNEPEFKHLTFLKNELNHPAINLYFLKLSRNKNWGADEFIQFKESMLQNFSALPFREKKVFLLSAINDTVVLVSKGHTGFLNDMFELYKKGIEAELLIHEGFMTVTTFNNIVLVANNLLETAFVKGFISKYIDCLPEETKLEARLWSESQTLYSSGYSEKVIDHIGQYNFRHALYGVLSRGTLLKANYDVTLKDPSRKNLFLSYCDSFEQYMRRGHLFVPDRNEAYIRLAQYTKKLMNIALHKKGDKEEKLKKLKARLEKEKNIFGKLWLLRKIDELKSI